MNKLSLCVLFSCISIYVFSQKTMNRDYLSNKSSLSLRSQIVPIGLMSLGGLIFITKTKKAIQRGIGDITKTKIDDYLQYIPDFTVYGAHFLGIKHKNTLWNTAKFMAISQIATCIIVQSVKRITNLPRPYGGRCTFPSGHTSQSFVGATAQYHEFKDFNPIFAYCGYAFATVVGVMRVTNNRHWTPDVLVGAGLGMLVTNIVYFYEPLKNWNPFKKKKYSVVPSVGLQGSTAIVGLNITL